MQGPNARIIGHKCNLLLLHARHQNCVTPGLALLEDTALLDHLPYVAMNMQRLIEIRGELSLTMMLVEQSATVALRVVDYGYVLENGRIVLDGDAARLRDHPDIQEVYLGQSRGGMRRSYRTVKQYRRNRRWYG